MVTIQLDIAGDTQLGPFLQSIEKYDGHVSATYAIGPGGGNPMVSITFPTKDKVKEYLLTDYCPDDEGTAEYLLQFAA